MPPKTPLPLFQREVATFLAREYRMDGEHALRMLAKWSDVVTLRHEEGKTASNVAGHIMKYERQKVVCPCKTVARDCICRTRRARHARRMSRVSRDPSNPQPGEVYETKFGNRWLVTGKTSKGRLTVKRAGNRYDGELQWTPAMFAKLKQVRAEEARAVRAAASLVVRTPPRETTFGRWLGIGSGSVTKEAERFKSGVSLAERTRGLPQRDPRRGKRRYYVYVIEQLRHGKREFYVGQTGKTPEKRFKEHKTGHLSYSHGGIMLRKDLYAKMNPLYSRTDAEKMEKVVARTLRKRGLKVKGGH